MSMRTEIEQLVLLYEKRRAAAARRLEGEVVDAYDAVIGELEETLKGTRRAEGAPRERRRGRTAREA